MLFQSLPSEPSFRDYVRDFASSTDNLRGDVVGDAQRDARLPHARELRELLRYIQHRTPDPDVLAAARLAWANYRNFIQRRRAR